jgi:glycerol uptake facilitator-like aquaporin
VDISRRLVAETAGTAFLLAAIVGSGIMADRLAGGNVALTLLCNSLATGAMLAVLIAALGPVSGAHFNPAVTLAFFVKRSITKRAAAAYVACQIVGGVLGTWTAHLMFGEAIFQVSTTARAEPALWFAELVATFGLLLTILGTLRWKAEALPFTVGLYIISAYWFTASTSFANPAVTLARAITDTFAGISPAGVPAFVLAQFVGALLATIFFGWLFSASGAVTRRTLRQVASSAK